MKILARCLAHVANTVNDTYLGVHQIQLLKHFRMKSVWKTNLDTKKSAGLQNKKLAETER